jgi:hypothetical protein
MIWKLLKNVSKRSINNLYSILKDPVLWAEISPIQTISLPMFLALPITPPAPALPEVGDNGLFRVKAYTTQDLLTVS